jgi:SnoaL-like protein
VFPVRLRHAGGVTIEAFRDWLERYFEAWVSNDPDDVESLFTHDAVYWTGPFAEPRVGVADIVAAWVGGPQEEVEYAYEPLAVEGELAIAHWRVVSRRDGAKERDEYDGILAITFAPDGRCVEHREWFSHRTTD